MVRVKIIEFDLYENVIELESINDIPPWAKLVEIIDTCNRYELPPEIKLIYHKNSGKIMQIMCYGNEEEIENSCIVLGDLKVDPIDELPLYSFKEFLSIK